MLIAYMDQVLIGIILGNGQIEINSKTGNARFIFFQSIIDEGGYLLIGVGIIFIDIIQYCDIHIPRLNPFTYFRKPGKPYLKSFFISYFNFTYYLFYSCSGIKSIPKNIIDYLTPISLAYWIINSGYKTISGTYIYIYSYNLKDIGLLQGALLNNFNLVSFPIINNKGQRVLYIPIKQTTPLSYIVQSHIINSDYINNPI